MDYNEQHELLRIKREIVAMTEHSPPQGLPAEFSGWVTSITAAVIDSDNRLGDVEVDRESAFVKQQEALRDEAIARRDLARLQLKLWRRVVSLPGQLLGCLQDTIATLRQ